MSGSFVYVKVSGDPAKAIGEGYTALFEYIGKHALRLKSPAGIQISTFEGNVVHTEIYLELE